MNVDSRSLLAKLAVPLLLLQLFVLCCGSTTGPESVDVLNDVFSSICNSNFTSITDSYLDFCRKDRSSGEDTACRPSHRFVFTPLVNLTCPSLCPGQTVEHITWCVHLFSFNYPIRVCYTHNATSATEAANALSLKDDFLLPDSLAWMQFRMVDYYHQSLIGCTVRTGNCSENKYYSLQRVFLTEVTLYSQSTVSYVTLGSRVTVTCSAVAWRTQNIYWTRNGSRIDDQFGSVCTDFNLTAGCFAANKSEEYRQLRVRVYHYLQLAQCTKDPYLTVHSVLDIAVVDWADDGAYTCVIGNDRSTTNGEQQHNVIVDVLPQFLKVPEAISISNLSATYVCRAVAGWHARLEWHLNGSRLSDPDYEVSHTINNESNMTEYSASEAVYYGNAITTIIPVHTATLRLINVTVSTANTYECVITELNEEFLRQYNKHADMFRSKIRVTKTDPSVGDSKSIDHENSTDILLIVIPTIGVFAVILVLLLLSYVWCRKYLAYKGGNLMSPTNFALLSVTTFDTLIDSSMGNKFPREQINFLHILGEGQFGKVWKATAKEIVPNMPQLNIVAVKTVKEPDMTSFCNELYSELAILLKIAPHSNICNLLGYCASDGKPPCLILEYCLYGKLKDYLIDCFNELSSEQFPPPQGISVFPTRNKTSSSSSGYVNIAQTSILSPGCQDLLLPDLSTEGLNSVFSGYTNSIAYAANSSASSEYGPWNLAVDRYRKYSYSLAPLYNEDVVNFALQIAHGLQHLEKMKICHGDLAARNILIAEGFLLKIADFGLATYLGSEEVYQRTTNKLVPLKWSAIESLQEQMLSYSSDMWSYGVVLWEILSYGKTPYEDIKGPNALQKYLEDGNRLPAPAGCSANWYQLMLECWNGDMSKRPNATEVINRLSAAPFTNRIRGLSTEI